MLSAVRRLLKMLLILNWVAVAGFILLAIILTLLPDRFLPGLERKFGDNAADVRLGIIGILLIGSTVAVPVHVIFARLIAMIDTVRSGRPFTAINAVRLRHIAWAVLVVQIIDLGFGYAAQWMSEMTGQAIGWQISVTGWLSVLLLFVLARVFQQGAAMQEELEGTV